MWSWPGTPAINVVICSRACMAVMRVYISNIFNIVWRVLCGVTQSYVGQSYGTLIEARENVMTVAACTVMLSVPPSHNCSI